MNILKKMVLLGALAGTAGAATGAMEDPAVKLAVQPLARTARVKDVTEVEGIRDNMLVGYGLVVGLGGTGDRQQTLFSTQTLANYLLRMGVQIPAATVRVNNVAAVFVTATLPPFSRPGMKIDVTISSIGDARSLQGGMLLLTPLSAPDGQVYAVAQGPLTLGGYAAGGRGSTKVTNHPTVGRIPEGALVERNASVDLTQFPVLSLLLREADFAAAREIAQSINQEVGGNLARVVDSRRIEIANVKQSGTDIPGLLARIGDLPVHSHPAAKVIVNERTGTVVMGGAVTLTACSILHGGLSIQVLTDFKVSQPEPFSKGETTTVPESTVQTQESAAQVVQLKEGASVEDLVRGLQTMGATARDIVSILQAIKAAGALQADLEVM
jgi:flagellar P-ring protein precursor FlgI